MAARPVAKPHAGGLLGQQLDEPRAAAGGSDWRPPKNCQLDWTRYPATGGPCPTPPQTGTLSPDARTAPCAKHLADDGRSQNKRAADRDLLSTSSHNGAWGCPRYEPIVVGAGNAAFCRLRREAQA